MNKKLNINNTKRICEMCKGTLVPIGRARSNGKDHDDWADRKYHKRCWVYKKRYEEMRAIN